jgi:hypothetical protein
MLKRSRFVIAAGLLVAVLAGCPNLTGPQQSSLSLVDANSQRAVLEYAKNWSGWEILPSSIWVANLPAGDTSRFRAARVQTDLQAAGDFYVAERPTDNGKGSRVVAGQFSTGDEWTLLRGNVRLTGRIFRQVMLEGDRAVYRSPAGLTVYSLSQRAVLKTIPLTEPAVELLAVGGKYALIALDQSDNRRALVNLDDGTAAEPPAAPNGFKGFFFDAALSDTALITAALTDESAGPVSAAILILDLPAQTWRILADYGQNPGGHATSRSPAVQGATEQVVLVSLTDGRSQRSFELIDRATGERTAVANLPLEPSCAILRGNQIYWVDPTLGVIWTYDVTTHATSTYPANLPGD